MFLRIFPRAPLALAAALGVLSSACTDQLPTVDAVPPPDGEAVRAGITCTVAVNAGEVRCEPVAGAGGVQNIILGGQGTYVRLVSSALAYDSVAGVFSMDVTVQNLLAQQMGTPDGTTVSGVKVFFERLPAATGGSGDVTVANADGRGGFTGLDQPYFEYPQILEGRGSTQPRSWRFNVPKTVSTFGFAVYVDTKLPAEQGVLRWRHESGAALSAFGPALFSAWVGGVNDVFISGQNHISHWDGNDWTSFELEARGNSTPIRDMAGSSRRQLYAVGVHGSVFRYDGNRWTEVYGNNTGFFGYLEGVWASGDTVVAVGHGQGTNESFGGQIMVSVNAGQNFTRTTFTGPTQTRQLWDVSGTSMADLWAVGFDERPTSTGRTQAVVMRSTNGGASWDTRIHVDDGHRYYGGVWAEPGRVIVGGGHINITTGKWEALLMESTDGGQTWNETWFAVPGKNRYVREVWGTPGGTVHAVGNDGSTFINTGSGWTDVTGATGQSLWGLSGAGGEAWAVGTNGAVVRYRAGAWAPVNLQLASTGTLRSVWGTSRNNVYAVGHRPGPNAAEQSVLMRYNGSGWTTALPAADSTEYADVWGSGASDVYVVGHRLTSGGGSTGMIWHYDGAGWTATATPFTGTSRRLAAVWGSGPGDVWVLGGQQGAAGHQTVMLHSTDGGATWTESALGNAPHGEGHVVDAWGSGPANIYAVGWRTDGVTGQPRSLVMRYDGAAWTATTLADSVRLSGVWGSGAENVYVAGYWTDTGVPYTEAGILRRTVNGGATWTKQRFTGTSFQNRGLRGIWGTAANDIYVVGAGPIMHFNGASWREQGNHRGPRLRAVWGSSAGNVFAVGEKDAILHGVR
jgi:hypothetical protein